MLHVSLVFPVPFTIDNTCISLNVLWTTTRLADDLGEGFHFTIAYGLRFNHSFPGRQSEHSDHICQPERLRAQRRDPDSRKEIPLTPTVTPKMIFQPMMNMPCPAPYSPDHSCRKPADQSGPQQKKSSVPVRAVAHPITITINPRPI